MRAGLRVLSANIHKPEPADGAQSWTAGERIDHVLVRGSLAVRDAALVEARDGERWPSDHAFRPAEIAW